MTSIAKKKKKNSKQRIQKGILKFADKVKIL